MNGLISRADLINYLDICINDTNGKPPLTDAVLVAIKCAVELIPSVDAETIVHGHWVKYSVDVAEHPYHCSACGYSDHHVRQSTIRDFNYCPNCGAKMDEEII